MAVQWQGVYSRSAGLISAIAKQLRGINLKPVTRIAVQFDPFHERAKHARQLIQHISTSKIQATNLFCSLKTRVVCDNSEPLVTCDLASGEKIIFKLGVLDELDALKLFNKHVSSLVPEEAPAEPVGPKKKKKLRLKRRTPRNRR